MTNEETYTCPKCGGETPMQEAQQPRGVKMYLHCAECGETLSDEEVARRKMMDTRD